jgi:hypothetical protein
MEILLLFYSLYSSNAAANLPVTAKRLKPDFPNQTAAVTGQAA